MDLPEDMVSSVVEIPTDEKRNWEIRNDNTLKAKRNQPRLWSQEFASSNVIVSKDGQTIINPEYVDTLVKMRQDAIDLSKVLNEPTIQDLSYAYDEAATQVVKILNYMGIPFDRETLDAYTYQVKDESDGKNPMLSQLQALQMMLGGSMQKKNGSKIITNGRLINKLVLCHTLLICLISIRENLILKLNSQREIRTLLQLISCLLDTV